MILSDGERRIVLACCRAQAMQWGEASKRAARVFNKDEAARCAAFSMECTRVGDLFEVKN